MIFDTFTFFNELDLLELRFKILDKYVDKFILVESNQTFSGQPKPLYYFESFYEEVDGKTVFKENSRFAKWDHKVIHIVVGNTEVTDGNLFKRHYLCYEAIEEELMKYDPDDIAFCSDLDEIWNPLRINDIDDKPHSLIQHNYSYYLNYLSNEVWTGSLMTKVKNIYLGFNKQNRTTKPFPLQDGGWHFSNQGGVEQIIKKLEAYDHSNEVLPMLSQFEGYGIKDRMEKGYDFLGREFNYQGFPFEFKVSEKEWPQYLKDNKEKYKKHLK